MIDATAGSGMNNAYIAEKESDSKILGHKIESAYKTKNNKQGSYWYPWSNHTCNLDKHPEDSHREKCKSHVIHENSST